MRKSGTGKMSAAQETVYKHILERVADGTFPPGSKIPSETELACLHGVSRMSAHRALKRLEERGLLRRNKRGGTTVIMTPGDFATGDLKRKVSRFVAVLNPLPPAAARIHWNSQITAPLRKGLAERGLSLREFDASGIRDPEAMSEKLRELARLGAAAVLCVSAAPLTDMLEKNPEIFFSWHRRVFLFARNIVSWSSFPYNIVSVDLFDEGVIAAEHIFAAGFRRVFYGVDRPAEGSGWLKARRDGLRCGLGRLSEGALLPANASLDNPPAEMLNPSPDEKIALVAASDSIAADFINKIRAVSGKSPGRDYGVISFNDDTSLKKYRLTTIAPPLPEIGAALAELIGASGKERERTTFIKIKSRLIIRETA
jgi:DNA-binding LacI/PurR family transcriptional regulator